MAAVDPEPTDSGEYRAARVLSDLTAILDVDITRPGWEQDVAEHKAFYVRGISWFLDRMMAGRMSPTDAERFIPRLKSILKTRSHWRELAFDWDERFSFRQFLSAASRTRPAPLKFQKAVEVIVLCEAIASELQEDRRGQPHPEDVYRHLSVAPAIFSISGFDRQTLSQIPSEKIPLLEQTTGQPSTVLYDMADGKTVTRTVAQQTKAFIEWTIPDPEIGEIRAEPHSRRKAHPSPHELLDAQIVLDLPNDLRLEHRKSFHFFWHSDRLERRPAGVPAQFLVSEKSEGGTWLVTREGLPKIAAFVAEEAERVTILWPRSAAEADLAGYFRKLAEDSPGSEYVVTFFYPDHAIIDEPDDRSEEGGEQLLPDTIPPDWRSGAASVLLELRGKDDAGVPSIVIWYTSGSEGDPIRQPREAGVELPLRGIGEKLNELARVIDSTHVTISRQSPPLGSSYAWLMLEAMVERLGQMGDELWGAS